MLSFKKNTYSVLFLTILIVAAFLRLYRLPQTLMFQGDQGRDAIIVARMFTEADPVFVGPVASVGNIYLGPFYYYFMLPFLVLTYPSPVGPAIAVAFLSIATVYLIYRFGKELFNERIGLIAAFLFAFSSVVVQYSRFSWNPNPMPFFALLMFYFTYMAWKKNPWYWVGVSICFSILIQLHYVSLLMAAGAGIIWLWQLIEIKNQKEKTKRFLLSTVISALVFLISLIPLVLFDFKHDFLNARAFIGVFTKEEAFQQDGGFLKTLRETQGRGMHVLFEQNIGKNRKLNTYLLLASVLFFLDLVFLRISKKGLEKNKAVVVLAIYLFSSILGTAFLKSTIFDHYILFLMPLTYFFFAVLFDKLFESKIFAVIPLVAMLGFLYFNFPNYKLNNHIWSIDDFKRTAQEVADHVEPGEKYNIVLLSESKDLYGQSYRYYLETIKDKKPLKVEQYPEADSLFIINENQKGEDILSLPIYEIMTFPSKEISLSFKVSDGPEIVKLER